MIYWAIYDIVKNKNRKKIADLCKDFGLERVQYSSFMGNITKNKAEMLAIEAKRFLGEEDKMVIMPAAKEDFSKKIVFGKSDIEEIANTKEVIFVD